MKVLQNIILPAIVVIVLGAFFDFSIGAIAAGVAAIVAAQMIRGRGRRIAGQ